MPSPPRAAAAYDERLTPSPGVWAALGLVSLGLAPVTVVALPPAGVLLAVAVAFAVGALLLLRWSPRVRVADGELVAGDAHVPVGLLGEPVALDAVQSARLRGADIDPRAYHLIRPWVPTAVRVPLVDPDDPTPYWYVATRSPERLADAIRAAQRG